MRVISHIVHVDIGKEPISWWLYGHVFATNTGTRSGAPQIRSIPIFTAQFVENLTAVNAVCAGSHIFKSEWETDASAMLGIQAEIVNGIHTRRAVDSPRNGLLLFIVFEKYFDDSRIVIVKDKRESVYRMMVIDATAMGVKVCIPLPFLICGIMH